MSAAEEYAQRQQMLRRADVHVEQQLTSTLRLGMVRVSQRGIQFGDPPSDAYLLTAPIWGGPYVECEFGGFRIRQRTYSGDYVFQPQQTGASGFADSPVTVQMTVFDGAWFRKLAGEACDGRTFDAEPAAVRTWRDGPLDALLHAAWTRLERGGDQSQAWIDQASAVIARTIVRRSGAPVQTPDHKPLSRAQFGRVHDFVEANLHLGIGVAEMASAAGVSVFHFMRRFRATRGESPHQFLMSRRLARARDFVNGTDEALSSIAASVGYSSQSHMTAAFRSAMGVTPKWFRTTGG